MEYLVQLLETDEFKDNRIDTSWLDGLIREKVRLQKGGCLLLQRPSLAVAQRSCI